MILTLAILAVFIVIVLFVLDASQDPIITSNVSTYFQPFAAETVVKHEYAASPKFVWKTITRFSNYNFWFPGVLRLLPVVESNRYAHQFSFDQFDFQPGSLIRLRPFSLSPSFRGKIIAKEENKQLALEMRFNPVHKEIVVFDLNPTATGTSLVCRRTSRGLFSWMTIWGFSNSKSKILDNLGYFIPEEVVAEKNDASVAQGAGPQYSREAIIARAVQAGLDGNIDLINAIPDKPTRGMAKAMLVQSKRKGNTMPGHLVKALSEEPTEDTAISTSVSGKKSVSGLPAFSTTEDLIAFVVNKALDGDDDPLSEITDKPTRGKAKAMLVKIKRGSIDRPDMPGVPSVDIKPVVQESDESEEGLVDRLVEAGLSGDMDEVNALDSRVLRGKIKAAIIKAKRAKA
ncbi:MAG: hypothetical protein H8E56_01040 [Candidatus Marinimicrobia bacterium]|nr:hypothetical protein [Candidatus Neomarinimicrobiota bacterium]